MLNGLMGDVRDSLRGIRRTAGACVVIVATAAVAVAAATLVFSFYEGVVLRPFPYPESGSLANVYMTNPRMTAVDDPISRRNGERFPLSYVALEAWQSSDGSPFIAFGGYRNSSPLALGSDPESAPLEVARMTAGAFEALGVRARHGRLLSREEDRIGGPRVVVLADAAWRARFGGDRSILGRELWLGDQRYEVIGIMPPGFYFPERAVDAWIPFSDTQRQAGRNSFFIHGLGRLRPGVMVEEARRTMDVIAERVGTTIGSHAAGANVIARRELVLGDVDKALALLMGTVLIVVLVASLNITSLLLSRAEGRASDLAIRAALGAGSGRIVRLTLVDTLVLAGSGGFIGIAFARLALQPSLALLPEALPREDNIAFNGTVLVFALSTIIATALVATFLPALQAIRTPPRVLLARAGRGAGTDRRAQRTRSLLVMAEVAGAVVLLVGAALLTLSYARLTAVQLGFDPSDVVAVSVTLPSELTERPEAAHAWSAAMLDELRAVPGVAGAVLTADVPLSGASAFSSVEYERADGELVAYEAAIGAVAPGHFALLRADVVAGREFEPDEYRNPAHGVLVNEAAATRLWPGLPAIGRRVRSDGEWHVVIGVVSDIRTVGPAEDPAPRVYVPRDPSEPFGYVLVRTSVPAAALVRSLESVISQSALGVRPSGTSLLEEELAAAVAHPRFRSALLIALAIVAALLAVIGIYGVVGHSVARQRREIGIRIALGARGGDVVSRVIGHGVALTAVGGATGILVAVPMSRVLTEFLFEVQPAAPSTLVGVLAVLLIVAAAASYFPARRAASIDPAESLRAD